MKKFLFAAVLVAGFSFSSVGFARHYSIHPWNIESKCFHYNTTTVRDHRYNPTRTSYVYTAAIAECASIGNAKRLNIQTLNGQDWNGQEGNVTIRNMRGLCLTNPATYRGNRDRQDLRFEACRAQNGSLESARQRFWIRRNHRGATRFESHLQYAFALPNAQKECIERTSQGVVRQVCNNLNNWMIRPVR